MERINVENALPKLSKAFLIEGTLENYHHLTNGHIHDSFYIRTDKGREYLLQRVNYEIFSDVHALMDNIRMVCDHLQDRKRKGLSYFTESLKLVPTHPGEWFKLCDHGCPWRMYEFIPDSRAHSIVCSLELAEEGGRAFGAFMRELSCFPAKKLHVTIPRFHDFGLRYSTFLRSMQDDNHKRSGGAKDLIGFITDRADRLLDFNRIILEELPLRITHNDTKFNNILFNDAGKALCVIDLDTVMPGSALHDYGDALRTATNKAAEDERDITKVAFDLDIYSAFTRGYMSRAAEVLTPKETENLAYSAIFMTSLIGLRFLTDYLDGDTYFHTEYPDHNLVRARVQFRLAELMEARLEEMNAAVRAAYDPHLHGR